MRLWDWAVGAYGRPGVADACLNLQDAHGQNTCLLLWAVWAGATPHTAAPAAELARAWDAAAVTPLRDVRRALKSSFPPVADEERERLRNAVKAAELQSERLLLEALERLCPQSSGAAPLDALVAASAAWGAPAPQPALAALAAALQ
ncbi:TIGR02444 family protein [Phenylobacterium deserti]|uniref:TIGR02444 family protein n=1 Tax=Phenylobacterium deserti TaxID=1914756 RepID=A0A328ARC8_9CAUL|nr:TIGR02444 family protein [Phenylobacterium deserti]RAK57510.1 TIGR02444 family protein [Phenylobacterium deserti]